MAWLMASTDIPNYIGVFLCLVGATGLYMVGLASRILAEANETWDLTARLFAAYLQKDE